MKKVVDTRTGGFDSLLFLGLFLGVFGDGPFVSVPLCFWGRYPPVHITLLETIIGS